MLEIIKVLNFNENIFVDDYLFVIVGFISMMKGGSWSGNKLVVIFFFGLGNFFMRKKFVLYVENDNNLCLFIVIGLCFLKICKKVDVNIWEYLIKGNFGMILENVIYYKIVLKWYYGNLLKKFCKKG